ncbi:MAG: TetR/AcrR family transcriptional regulator [Polyangiaceae bacterium]|jgi:AcrR family transcriptional regulator|nr:TetR/AcrR family transcriptional regulator [Polyangiaceae bacterium]
MARPTTIQNDDILRAARELIMERGLAVTTAEVAARARVSEGILFKRFKTKENLLHAAMVGDFTESQPFDELEKRVGKGEVQEQLYEHGLEMWHLFRKLIPLIMMLWSTRSEEMNAQLHGPNPPPLQATRRMAGYLEAEMRLGRLRRSDPEILARTFLGAIWNHAFLEQITERAPVLPLPIETFLRGFIQLLWGGIAPEPPPTTRAQRPR